MQESERMTDREYNNGMNNHLLNNPFKIFLKLLIDLD